MTGTSKGLGFYADPVITMPSYGGSGGSLYSIHNVVEIELCHPRVGLYYLIFKSESGATLKVGEFSCSSSTTKITLDLPKQYFTGFSGTVGTVHGNTVVSSITFYTSTGKTYGPYGAAGATPFSFQQSGGQITGFHGRSGHLVDAIGAYVKPVCQTPGPKLSMAESS